ncbi:actin depolymerizing protein, partial [Calocera cornea HHB12733]
QSSGIGVSNESVAKFEELRLGKVLKLARCFSLARSALRSPPSTLVGPFAYLLENECKWAIYDFAFEVDDGGKRNKIVLISWYPCPMTDDAKVKQKMIYASSKEALKRKLQSDAIAAEVQRTDYSEVAYEIGMF